MDREKVIVRYRHILEFISESKTDRFETDEDLYFEIRTTAQRLLKEVDEENKPKGG